jgi:hypothetical protein
MKLLKFFPAIILCFVIPLKSQAWGQLGHRIVGQVAEAHLTPNAKKAVRAILGDTTLAMASNWGDFIKSDSNYKDLDPWHYMNLPDGLSAADIKMLLSNDSAVNVYTKTMWLVKQLKKKNIPKSKKSFYLKLLIHFVGDINQPMHVARETDRGANDIKVTWFSENSNLHSVWDRKLIDDQQLSYTEYTRAIDHPTALQRKTWMKQPVSEWIMDSYVISRKIYQGAKPDSRLSYNYIFTWIGIVNQQLLKGGLRLAGLLNEIYK